MHVMLFIKAGIRVLHSHPLDNVSSEVGFLPLDAAAVQRDRVKVLPCGALKDIRHSNISSAKHQMHKMHKK